MASRARSLRVRRRDACRPFAGGLVGHGGARAGPRPGGRHRGSPADAVARAGRDDRGTGRPPRSRRRVAAPHAASLRCRAHARAGSGAHRRPAGPPSRSRRRRRDRFRSGDGAPGADERRSAGRRGGAAVRGARFRGRAGGRRFRGALRRSGCGTERRDGRRDRRRRADPRSHRPRAGRGGAGRSRRELRRHHDPRGRRDARRPRGS